MDPPSYRSNTRHMYCRPQSTRAARLIDPPASIRYHVTLTFLVFALGSV